MGVSFPQLWRKGLSRLHSKAARLHEFPLGNEGLHEFPLGNEGYTSFR
jgi:hypothetical protein